MTDSPGGLTENLIACITALGQPRPESKSLDELYKALAVALAEGAVGGGVQTVVAGDNVTVDDTDPQNPIVSSTGGGGGSALGFYTPVRLASIDASEMTLSPPSGPANIDGVDVVTGDRILLTQLDVQDDQGIWIANTTDVWTRAPDMAVESTLISGSLIPTGDDGNQNFNAIFILGNETGIIIVDTPMQANMVVSYPALSFSPNFRGFESFPPIADFAPGNPVTSIASGESFTAVADTPTNLPADGSSTSVQCILASPPFWMDDESDIIVDGLYVLFLQITLVTPFTTPGLFLSVGPNVGFGVEIIPCDALNLNPSPGFPISLSVDDLNAAITLTVAMPTDATGVISVTPTIWKQL